MDYRFYCSFRSTTYASHCCSRLVCGRLDGSRRSFSAPLLFHLLHPQHVRRKLTRKLYPPSPNTQHDCGMLDPFCVGTPSLRRVSLIISTRVTAWHGVIRSEAPARISTCLRRAPERCGLGQVCEVSGGEPRAYRRILCRVHNASSQDFVLRWVCPGNGLVPDEWVCSQHL